MTNQENNHYQEPNQNMPPNPDLPPYPDMPSYSDMPPQVKKPKNRYASTALMFGIFSIINLCSFMFPMAIVMGVSAVCFAVLSKNSPVSQAESQRQGLKQVQGPMHGQEPEQALTMSTGAKVGLVMGAIAAILGVIEYFVMLNIYDMMKDPELIPYFNDALDKLMEYMQQNPL